MILSDLFQKLFVRGVTLIATSNIAPDGLYKTGFTVIVLFLQLKWLKELCRFKCRCRGGLPFTCFKTSSIV